MAVEVLGGFVPLRVRELALMGGTAVGKTMGVGTPIVGAPFRLLARHS